MRIISRNQLLLAVCTVAINAGSLMAQDLPQPHRERPGDGPGHPRKPPEVAFAACDDLEEGDVCQVSLPDRNIQGECVPTRDEARLHCRPDHPPGPPPQR